MQSRRHLRRVRRHHLAKCAPRGFRSSLRGARAEAAAQHVQERPVHGHAHHVRQNRAAGRHLCAEAPRRRRRMGQQGLGVSMHRQLVRCPL
jgi:hypothetical protein